MPLVYESAPILVSNRGVSDTPQILDMLDGVQRGTLVAKFASKFRTRRKPLDTGIGREIIDTYERFRENGAEISSYYVDALPYSPPGLRWFWGTLEFNVQSCPPWFLLRQA